MFDKLALNFMSFFKILMVAGFRQKIRKPLLLILESREVNIKFQRLLCGN
jgi:hypothetical protein